MPPAYCRTRHEPPSASESFRARTSCAHERNARFSERWHHGGGPRSLLSLLALVASISTPLSAQLVINEIDYDNVGTDTAEFVEIKNIDVVLVNLADYTLELVNGNLGGAAVYATYSLAPAVQLAPGGYLVLCANPTLTPHCDLDVSPDTNLIQNGAPDAVALRHLGTLIDTVSYDGDTGAPYTEGSGSGLIDDGQVDFAGISRFPDGADTNQNNVDLSPRCITPGQANTAASAACLSSIFAEDFESGTYRFWSRVVSPQVPDAAELIVNEFMASPLGTDSLQEWFEVLNLTGRPLDLVGCTLDGSFQWSASAPLAAGGFLVIARSTDPVVNGGITGAVGANFALTNADSLTIDCFSTLIDTVSWTSAVNGESTSLDPDFATAVLNDPETSWCPNGTDVYGNGTGGTGTPGAANPECP